MKGVHKEFYRNNIWQLSNDQELSEQRRVGQIASHDFSIVRIKYFIRKFAVERDYVYSKTIGKTGFLYVYVVKSYTNRTSDFTTYWN